MTIMVAGGLTFAIPGVMPEAMAANANLYVSAENSDYSNTMTGPQVVEVVVIDDDINETNESNGEPDVTINGKKLRMAQATDGNWYGYFADKTQATVADSTTTATKGGIGLDFGQFCGAASNKFNSDETTQMFSDTVGVAIPVRSDTTANTFGVNGTTTIVACNTSFNGNAIISANSTHINESAAGPVAGAAGTVNTSVSGTVENVVREAKKINTITSHNNGIGQIGLKDDGLWPFIQLYDLTTGGNVIVKYNKGGGVQTTTLLFDTYPDVTETLDQSKYSQGSQVHFTVSDPWLNIDPTDEDSWTFATNSTKAIYYQVFNENGVAAADADSAVNGSPNVKENLSTLMAEESDLLITGNPQGASTVPLVLQDTADTDQDTTCTTLANCTTDGGRIPAGGQPVTLVETDPTSGMFTTYDEGDNSQLKIASGAIRGTSATIDYGSAHTILVGNYFATLDIEAQDDTWNSGEEIPVVLVDGDMNKNSRADEDLKVSAYTNATLVPALETGDPFTLGENRTSAGVANMDAIFARTSIAASSTVVTTATTAATGETVAKYSEIALLDPHNAATGVDSIIIDYNLKLSDLLDTVKDTRSATSGRLLGTNLLNMDVSGFNATGTFDVYILNNTAQIITASNTLAGSTGSLQIANNVDPISITSINGSSFTDDNSGTFNLPTELFGEASPTTKYVGLLIRHNSGAMSGWTTIADSAAAIPIAVDFFSFGFTDDGAQASERVSNQLIRIEVEETGDNTAVFEGSLEFVMVNQLNIYLESTYTGLTPVADDPSFIVIEDLTDEDSPRVNYLDLGSDGVSTQIADQQSAPTHSGVVSLDNDNYKVADTVTVTLEDADLNTDSELIDIYTVVKSGAVTYDMVGGLNGSSQDLPTFGWGSLGRLLDITYDDEQWLNSSQGTVTCSSTPSGDNGLGATNFSLVETSTDSGVFTGDFQIPSEYCQRTGKSAGANGSVKSTTGVDIEVNYVDFRDASGEIIEVGDGAGELLAAGDLTIHVRVNDPDYDLSATGEDTIATMQHPA
jgi:hypothetical protein